MDPKEREEWEALFGPEWEKGFYSDRGNDPSWWLRSAEKLLAVVRLLYPGVEQAYMEVLAVKEASGAESALALMSTDHMRAWPVLAMLRGMAVENLLKAIYCKQQKLVVHGKYAGPKTHDLERLARDAGVDLSSEESSMLSKLSLQITVYGRYPIGLGWDFDRKVRVRTGDIAPVSVWGPEDNHRCDGFVERVKAITCTT